VKESATPQAAKKGSVKGGNESIRLIRVSQKMIAKKRFK
jgi:hypothetical protein